MQISALPSQGLPPWKNHRQQRYLFSAMQLSAGLWLNYWRVHEWENCRIKQGNPVFPTEPASTAILFYFYYLKLIQLYWCFYKVFSAPLKFLLLSKFLLHCCFYEVSTASLKLLLFQQCFLLHCSSYYKVIVSMMS